MKTMVMYEVLIGNSRNICKQLNDNSIDVCVTSPPYYNLRDYGSEDQLGLEATPKEYIENICDIFDIIYPKLKNTGSLWVNMGDTYCASGKQRKSLLQIPNRFSIEMVDRGWILRNEIIWHKPNVMPSSAKDRFTVDFEKMFFFTKSQKYFFNQLKEPLAESSIKRAKYAFNSDKANLSTNGNNGVHVSSMTDRFVKNDGRNMRCVWNITPSCQQFDHVAMFPKELASRPIQACCPTNGTVLDPFCGSGTTLQCCYELGVNSIGIDIDPKAKDMTELRIADSLKNISK